jgi:hypothetical protein
MKRLLDPTVETAGATQVPAQPQSGPTITTAKTRPGVFAVIESDLGHIVVDVEQFAAATAPKVMAVEQEAVTEFKTLQHEHPKSAYILIGVVVTLAFIFAAFIIHIL